jgi:hypothetical protein
MGERDKSNGTEFKLNKDHRTIENRPGGTHPGAEHGAVRGRLMMSMVSGMLDGLCLCQPADGKDTEYQENRQEFKDAVVHQQMTDCNLPEY